MRRGHADVVRIARRAVKEFQQNDVLGLSAEIAFRLIFSLPPLVIFFASLSSVASEYTGVDVFTWITRQLQSPVIPASVYDTIEVVLDAVKEQGTPGLVSIGIVVALWSASGAVGAIMKALNRAYKVQDRRSLVRRRIIALALTIGLSVLMIGAFILFVFGGMLGEWLAGRAGYGSIFTSAWQYVRWPATVLLFSSALAIVYWVGPAVEQSLRLIAPGAILATLLWLLATWGFSFYLRVSDPGSAYGALGTVVVLLFFLYVSSIVLLTGAELNALLDERFHPETAQDLETETTSGTGAGARARPELNGSVALPQATNRAPRLAVTAIVASLVSIFVAALLSMVRRVKPRQLS